MSKVESVAARRKRKFLNEPEEQMLLLLHLRHFYLRHNDNVMEGVLWKWTNYWNGWQMRWFVLDNGVLSYYKSQEEVNQGCKGSMKVSACEIAVHPTENTRLDIIVPGEQHIYLKAATSQERQQWLIALGSTKACVTTTRNKKEFGESNPDSLRSKRFELRLYCDLLMQQVHQLKTCATEGNELDVNKLNGASGLVSATCDLFIKTLDDCMKLSDANFLYELPHQHVTDVPLSQSHHHKVKATIPVVKRSSSCEVSETKGVEKKS